MIRVAFCVGQYPEPERQRRIDAARAYATAEIEIGILDIPASPYFTLGPSDVQAVHPLLHPVYQRAEREGYDAAVPLGMLDLGVEGGRCLVDIPIIAPAQACLHVAALVGDRFGMIMYEDKAIPKHRSQIRAYGMEHFMAGYRSVGMSNNEMAANHDRMVETFVARARSLIRDDGAEVIIPHGVSQCPTHIKPDWLAKELGVPVVEGMGAPIRVAAMLAGLGLTHSRVRWPKAGK
jgi:Asp/Glu/hydantoin racemase